MRDIVLSELEASATCYMHMHMYGILFAVRFGHHPLIHHDHDGDYCTVLLSKHSPEWSTLRKRGGQGPLVRSIRNGIPLMHGELQHDSAGVGRQ